MIDASFNIPTDVMYNQTFNGLITFASDVTLFDAADITLTGIDGNGIQNITFTVTQQTPSTYSINFMLPVDVEGAFSVDSDGHGAAGMARAKNSCDQCQSCQHRF